MLEKGGPSRQATVARERVSLWDADVAAREVEARLRGAGALKVTVAGEVARRCDEVSEFVFLVRGLSFDGLVAALRGAAAPGGRDASAEHIAILPIEGDGRIQRITLPWPWLTVLTTSDAAHAAWLETRARERGLSRADLAAASTEDDVYALLGLEPCPPELREGAGARVEPELLRLEDVRGVIHAHTTSSDGRASLAAMVEEAMSRGAEYIGISDHMGIGRGMSREAVVRQAREIAELRRAYPAIEIFHGIEVDIEADGRLAAEDELLASLDFVVASVHRGFTDDAGRMTERLLAAVRHPLVTILGHPTGRLFGARAPAAIDVDAVARACFDHGVALEINGSPTRLDLPSQAVRSALGSGAAFVVAPDAHSTSELSHTKLAVGLARRGNVPRRAVINTRDRAEMSAYLRDRRARAARCAAEV